MGTSHQQIVSPHDGFALNAYRATTSGARKGGVIVVQEIFGVSPHIEEMCGAFAAAGYEALAPSLFDRVERNFSASHDEAGIKKGIAGVEASSWDQVAADIQAAIDTLEPPVFITGFCYGGAVTWLGAQKCTGLAAGSAYYGRLINKLLDQKPRIPIILHYGNADAGIPLSEVDKVRAAHPDIPIHLYDAGHGFCRRGSADYDAPSCQLAMERTLKHFEAHRQ